MSKRTCELIIVQPNPKCVLEPLTYYDPELQNAWNAPPDRERLQLAIEKSRRLEASYKKQLENLRSRLNWHTYERFAADQDSLFDSNLLEFSFGDHLGFGELRRRTQPRLSVLAKFLSFERDTLHELRYRRVETLRVNVPEERWYEMSGDKDLDSLLRHELTSSGESRMQHKFLFASGAAICIEFAQVRWETHRIAKQHQKR